MDTTFGADHGLAKATCELDLIICITRKNNDQFGKNKLFNETKNDYSSKIVLFFKTPIAKIDRASLNQISSSFNLQIVNVYTSLSQTQIYNSKTRIICKSFSSQKVYSNTQ